MAHGWLSVSAPQVWQKLMRSRAVTSVWASCRIDSGSACTMCRAMRSAERGPMPGNWFSAATSAVIGSGSVDMAENCYRLLSIKLQS